MPTIENVVNLVLSAPAYKSCDKFLAAQYAIIEYRAQTRGTFWSKISRPYTVENLVVKYPPAYLKWTKIGVCHEGKIALLSWDNNSCKDSCACETPVVEEDVNGCDCCSACGGLYGAWFGDYYGRAFGQKGLYNPWGYVTDDKENHRFLFSSNLEGKEVIIEFETLNDSHGLETNIDKFLIPVLANKIKIGLEMDKENPNLSKIQMLKQDTAELERIQKLESVSWSFNAFFKANAENYGLMKR
jgi:hypothetical protein